MKSRAGHNRAIADGDQGRFGGNAQGASSIRATMKTWTIPFLTEFIFKKSKSHAWKQAASAELEARLLPKKKKVPKTQRKQRFKRPRHPD